MQYTQKEFPRLKLLTLVEPIPVVDAQQHKFWAKSQIGPVCPILLRVVI